MQDLGTGSFLGGIANRLNLCPDCKRRGDDVAALRDVSQISETVFSLQYMCIMRGVVIRLKSRGNSPWNQLVVLDKIFSLIR